MKLITLVKRYISYRKSLGEQMKLNQECLLLFCRKIGKNSVLSDISSEKINDFLYGNGLVTTRWFSKYFALKGFYHYAVTRGYANHIPLPQSLPKKPLRFIPYIYSQEELRHIFESALVYKDRNRGYLDPYMIRVLFIVLYSTGLRLSEALSLTMADVDLSQSFFTICETKFYKTRLVPFGPQLSTVITEYLCWRKRQKFSQDKKTSFFTSFKGKQVRSLTIEFIFRRIRKIANIYRSDKASYQPRIHDLRHTFAVHRLTSWYQENKDVRNLLPILSTYLGHSKLSDTSVYLTMTDELWREASVRFEHYAQGGLQ